MVPANPEIKNTFIYLLSELYTHAHFHKCLCCRRNFLHVFLYSPFLFFSNFFFFLMEKKGWQKRSINFFKNMFKYILYMLPYGFMADIFNTNIPAKGVNGLEQSVRDHSHCKSECCSKVYFMYFYEKEPILTFFQSKTSLFLNKRMHQNAFKVSSWN